MNTKIPAMAKLAALKVPKVRNPQPSNQIFKDRQVMPAANPMAPMKLGQPGLMQALQGR